MQAAVGLYAAWALAALTALLVGCTSQPQRPAAADAMRAQGVPPDFSLYRQTLLSEVDVPCPNDGESCTVPVTMIMAKGSDNKVYCAAQLPRSITFSNSKKGNNEKTIAWKLEWDSGFKLSVAFQKTHGILLLDQGKEDQIHGGKWISPREFHMKNKHDEQNTAIYLPIILQVDDPNNPTLCAAADPKIINN